MVVENPKTEMDRQSRKKIIGFINDIISKNRFTKQDLYSCLKKQKVQKSSSYKDYVLLDIIEHFVGYTYNKKTKSYTVKSTGLLE